MKVEPTPGHALDHHVTSQRFGEVLHDREPEPGASDVARAPSIDAVETLEESRQDAWRRCPGRCLRRR